LFAWLTTAFLLGAAGRRFLIFGWLGDRIGRGDCDVPQHHSVWRSSPALATSSKASLATARATLSRSAGQWEANGLSAVALVMEMWAVKLAGPFLAGFIGAASNVGFLFDRRRGDFTSATWDANWRWMMLAGAGTCCTLHFYSVLRSRIASLEGRRPKTSHGSPSKPIAEIFGPRFRRTTFDLALRLAESPWSAPGAPFNGFPTWVGSKEFKIAGDPHAFRKGSVCRALQDAGHIHKIASCRRRNHRFASWRSVAGRSDRTTPRLLWAVRSLVGVLHFRCSISSTNTRSISLRSCFLNGDDHGRVLRLAPRSILPELFSHSRSGNRSRGSRSTREEIVGGRWPLFAHWSAGGRCSVPMRKLEQSISLRFTVGPAWAVIWLAPETKRKTVARNKRLFQQSNFFASCRCTS